MYGFIAQLDEQAKEQDEEEEEEEEYSVCK